MDWKTMFGSRKDGIDVDRKLTEAEAAILAEAKPKTEAEAIAALSAAKERIGGCGHIFRGRCQLHNVEADDKCRCSRWS